MDGELAVLFPSLGNFLGTKDDFLLEGRGGAIAKNRRFGSEGENKNSLQTPVEKLTLYNLQ